MAYRVIIADPGQSVKKAVRMALPENEFEVFPFHDVREIFEQLNEINPDIIMLSLSLPLKNIGQLHEQLQSQRKSRKVSLVLIKGLFEAFDEEKISELESDLILRIPFDSRTLAEGVRSLIEKRNDPQTLPEEPFLDGWADQGGSDNQEERIRTLAREEASEVEKKIKNHLIPELKAWLEQELEEIKRKLGPKD